jgi:hypothetical protein
MATEGNPNALNLDFIGLITFFDFVVQLQTLAQDHCYIVHPHVCL